jgi:hypothetical protein
MIRIIIDIKKIHFIEFFIFNNKYHLCCWLPQFIEISDIEALELIDRQIIKL